MSPKFKEPANSGFSLDSLNPAQREAVLHGEGPIVIYAGAGSGKTRVITQRVTQLIRSRAAQPYQILAVTFTNKAAREMRERLAHELMGLEQQLWIGTFHAVCARLLRQNAKLLGISPNFVIYDEADQRAMVNRVLRDLHIGERVLSVKQAAWRINRAKQEGLGPDQVNSNGFVEEIFQRIYQHYDLCMQRAEAFDFDDLIYRLVQGAEKNPALRETLQSRFRYVLVDEFQDTNRVQFALVSMLAEQHRNLCVVGDDDQSIYRWRGADYRNMLEFRERFPDAIALKLEQNYRSTKLILEAAYSVIKHNASREPKKLWTDNDHGLPVRVCPCTDERDEAYALTRQIQNLLNEGYSLSDMAVFYRTHAQSRVLEEALRTSGLGYRVIGGMRFYDRAEVKDVLAYLRVIHNPADDVSLLRVINTPVRGIGKSTIEQLLNEAARVGRGVWQALSDMVADDSVSKSTRKKLGVFHQLIVDLRAMLDEEASPADIARAVLERTGYMAALEAADDAEADARIENLRELIGSIAELEREGNVKTLSEFLENITLDTTQEQNPTSLGALSLMTVHAAKGLEFRVVFIAGLEERLFPYKGVDPLDDPEELEEERRLAYVALTRAREQLWLTYAVTRRLFGQLKVCEPSRFVEDIPIEITEQRPTPAMMRTQSQYSVRTHWDANAPIMNYHAGEKALVESYVDSSAGDTEYGESPVRVGMRVKHRSFGEGRIAAVANGDPPRATVRFNDGRTKQVLLSFLEPS